jgi:hypothetical protein
MDETTTVAPPDTGAAAAAQPADGATTTAAQPQTQTPPSQPAQADDEYAAWLGTKGLAPDGEQAEKAARMAYNSEKLMTKATQEASELRKTLTPSQPAQPATGGAADNGMQEFIADYKRDKLISGFKESHPDWHDHEPAMVKILGETTPSGYTKSQLVNAGVLSLEDIYAMAKSSAPVDTEKVKAETKNEVLHTLANEQRAGGGNGQASDSNPTAPVDDPVMIGIRRSRGQK